MAKFVARTPAAYSLKIKAMTQVELGFEVHTQGMPKREY